MSCFVTNTFVTELNLSILHGRNLISNDIYRTVHQRLEQLKDYIRILQRYYPEKNTIPPNEVKEELFFELEKIYTMMGLD